MKTTKPEAIGQQEDLEVVVVDTSREVANYILDRIKPKLFTMVQCSAYLKKSNDDVHIIMYEPDGMPTEGKIMRSHDGKAVAIKYDAKKGEDVVIKDLSDFCGEGVKKVYRERCEENFKGVVVGYTHIKVAGIIGTDWTSGVYRDHGYCFKQITDAPKVAVVYFKNNCKRYVLLNDLQPINNNSIWLRD